MRERSFCLRQRNQEDEKKKIKQKSRRRWRGLQSAVSSLKPAAPKLRDSWRFALTAGAGATAGPCSPAQPGRRGADTPTGVILMSPPV